MLFGLCRFSYLAEGGWRRHARDINDQMKYLFTEDRLKRRLDYFERFTLASMKSQTDQNFHFVVLSSTFLPATYQDRLNDLLKPVENAHLILRPPEPQGLVIRRVLADYSRNHKVRATFRVDDDDALTVHFVRRVREQIGQLNFPGFISFSRGLTLLHRRNDEVCGAVTNLPFSSAGLVFCTTADDFRTVYNFPHQKCFEHFATLVIPGAPAFIRNVHGENDSGTLLHGVREADIGPAADLFRKYSWHFPFLNNPDI